MLETGSSNPPAPGTMDVVDNFITKFGGWSESYFFYDGTVELRYDPKPHVYMLVTGDDLEVLAGVTSICHIIDKSETLIPWACKMMAAKLLSQARTMTLPTGDVVVPQMPFADFEATVLQAKTAHKEKLEEAGLVGNVAHNWIESYIKAVLIEDETRTLEILAQFPHEERAKNCCIAALSWMSRHRVRWIATERKIYSRVYKYAGTMDGLCRVTSCDDPNCCPHPFEDRLTIADWKSSNYLYMEYLLQTAAYQHAYEEEMGVMVDDRWIIRLGKDDGSFETWHTEREQMDEDFGGFLLALELTRQVASIKARIKNKAEQTRSRIKAAKALAKETARALEVEAKAKAKAEKQQAKAEALRERCKSADRYKGARAPQCNGGQPCIACQTKYVEVQGLKPTVVHDQQDVCLNPSSREILPQFQVTPEALLTQMMSVLMPYATEPFNPAKGKPICDLL